MVKISQLPEVSDPEGNEQVIVLKGGIAQRAGLSALVSRRLGPRIVQDYLEQAQIPMEERFPGLTVWNVADQRYFDLAEDDLTNAGWKTPSWLTPLQQGTITERNNRVGGYTGWPKRGMRFLQTDVFPHVLWEYRLAGDPSGPWPSSATLTDDTWVSIPQASDLVALSIDGFEALASSSDIDPAVTLRWSIRGTQPDTQTVSWGGTSITIPGSARSYVPKDWNAPKPLFVVGNSLSDATDQMDRWSRLLAARRGVLLYSVARYSSDWRQVYRAGVEPIYLTIEDDALPAGGTSAAITLINGRPPSDNPDAASGNPASFLTTGDAGLTTGLSMAGTLIDGANTRHVTVSVPNGASTAYSIVADVGSAALTLSGAVLFIPDVAKRMSSSDVILWPGNNYYYTGQPGEFGDHVNFEMHRDMAKLVAGAQGNRVLILPVIPATTMALGSDLYNAMLAANARTESLYPTLYARSADGRDLIKYLQDHGDGSAGDNSDIANGWIPRSLRRAGDPLHLNSAGDVVVADFVEEAFGRQSLPDPVTLDTAFALSATGTITYQVLYETRTATTSDVAVATISQAAAGVDTVARADILEILTRLGDVEMSLSGLTYTASIVPITAAMVAGTEPVLAANPNRRGLIIKPPGPCTVSYHAGEDEGIVSGLEFEKSGPACPKNAIYLHGLIEGAQVRIEEGV